MAYTPRTQKQSWWSKLQAQAINGSYEERLIAKIQIAKSELNRAELQLLRYQMRKSDYDEHTRAVENGDLPF